MATDIAIKFEGGKEEIAGESQLEGPYKDGWLEGFSFSESVSIPRDPAGSGAAAGRATVSEFQISTAAGTHSNILRNAILKNDVFKKVTVHFLKQIGEKNDGYDIRIYTNVFVSHYVGSKGNDGAMNESWSFGATKVEWEYKKQLPDSHELVTANGATWDVAASAAK